ncbi:CBL-interacting protein kinase 18-like [Impatiens glandulifera]|uniref:CBL-interacting protein kinase 18-like n=1 Tax=Impatiens glandulifera TaxID=253017 RepID=UPI001FB0CE97|nr:CBL-interacting protein kinase 18-like [Impatiens glandulifera]XP_047310887.1 CBL-interacting protein kinase 18-like [Impatiens glandulifera]XP_047310888.1 CBL-interacting protein kinase 18-like [Impatiens glandulifera]
MDKSRRVLMQKYELGRLLGQGSFARVYYARNLESGQAVAIKVMDKKKIISGGFIKQIRREISVIRLVKHPNVVQVLEVMATKTHIYLVMEFAKGGELFRKVAKLKLKEDVARKYFQQLINAVDFFHGRDVYHRDLKPENLLLDEDDNLKVIDFGLSALAESKHQDGLFHTMCGTPAYVAPEVIYRKGYDGGKADIWSCGIILFVLIAGYLPFYDVNIIQMYRKICRAEYKCPKWFSDEVRTLLSNMLETNPDNRITMAQVKESSWFRSGLSTTDTCSLIEGSVQEDMVKPKELNAFDIISLSAGFDLSGLFEEARFKKEARFMSRKPASVIVSKLEEMAEFVKMKVGKKEGGLMRFERTREGRMGFLSVEVEIFEVSSSFYLVEVRKNNGDSLEFSEMLMEGMRVALKDVVWAWHGELPLIESA